MSFTTIQFCLLALLAAASVSATGLLDPLGVLGSAKEGVLDAVDNVNRNFKDKLTPSRGDGEIVGDRDPSSGSTGSSGGGGLLGSLHLPGLNLFSGVPCIGAASLLSGKCDKPSECGKSGRVSDGPGLCLDGNVCCVETFKCGAMSLLNNSIFSSPNYPSGTTQTGRCTMTVKKMSLLVRAIRVVLEDVLLAPPNHRGECETDSLWIEGVNPGSGLARVCGRITSQPLYFPVGQSPDDTIRVKVVLGGGSLQRRWMIRIIQVDMLSPSLPPPGCTQYFTGTSGALLSFNTDVSNRTSLGNIDGLRYSICLRKEAGFCKVEFDPVFFDMGSPVASHGSSRDVYTFDDSDAPSRARRGVDERAPMMRLPTPRYRPSPMYLHSPSYLAPSSAAAAAAAVHPPFAYRPLPSSGLRMKLPKPIYSSAMLNKILDSKIDAKLKEYSLNAPIPGFYSAPASVPSAAVLSTPVHTPMYVPTHAGASPAVVAPEPYHPTNELIDEVSFVPMDGTHHPTAKMCAGQDVISFPPPDDETPSLHCGSNFHGGQQMTTSSRPFIIRINNKGLAHGRGFIIKYRHITC